MKWCLPLDCFFAWWRTRHKTPHQSRSAKLFSEGPGARFSKAPENFRAWWKTIAKPRTLRLQSCLIHMYIHTRSFTGIHFTVLRYRWTKMALRGWKVSGAFEKRAPGLHYVWQTLFWLVTQHFFYHLTYFSFILFLFFYLSNRPQVSMGYNW